MVAELSGWAALLAALFSIGLEMRRARASHDVDPSLERGSTHQRGDLPGFLRGVSAWSLFPAVSVALAALATQSWRRERQLRADYLSQCVDAFKCLGDRADLYAASAIWTWDPFFAYLTYALWVVAIVLVLRVAASYLVSLRRGVGRRPIRPQSDQVLKRRPEAEPASEPADSQRSGRHRRGG